jgi:hypothetical protein
MPLSISGKRARAPRRRRDGVERPGVAFGVRPLEIDVGCAAEGIAAVRRYRRTDGGLSPELMGAEPYLSCHGHV